MNISLGYHRGKCRNLFFLILLYVLHSNDAQNSTNTTPPPGNDPPPPPKPLQPWLIGVIVLSAILVIGVVVTIILRCRKRNEDPGQRYTIGDYE